MSDAKDTLIIKTAKLNSLEIDKENNVATLGPAVIIRQAIDGAYAAGKQLGKLELIPRSGAWH